MRNELGFDDSTQTLLNAALASAAETGRPDRAWIEQAGSLANALASFATPAAQLEPYGRRVLVKTDRAQIVLASWPKGGTSAPHDHGEAKGFVLVLSGTMRETRFAQTPPGLREIETRTFKEGETLCVDARTLHEMSALTDALTLHVYAPSCEGMRVVDRERNTFISVPPGHGAWLPEGHTHGESMTPKEIIWVAHTTQYRGGSEEFRVAARTLSNELAQKHPTAEIRLEALTTKDDFLRAIKRIDAEGARIRELHFLGHSGMYGIMFGSTKWPEQFSPHEWKTMHIPFAMGARAYFHACRTARWFAPFFARTFNVTAYGNQGYTTVSASGSRFRWAGPKPTAREKLYLVATPGKKSHGYLGSVRKYAGARVESMRAFSPQTTDHDASYDAVAKLYDEAFADIRVRETEWKWLSARIERIASTGRKPRVLDIGCGNGALLASLGDRISRGVGVDISHGMISQARTRHQTRGHLRFERIDGPSLPFENDSFDIIVSFLSFRYLDWDPMMQEIRRVLSPGGHVFVIDMVEKPVSLEETPLFLRSAFRHFTQHARHRSFSRKLTALTTHPDWKKMLAHNPIRAEHEYRWYFESRFPGRTVETLDVARTSRVIAFDSGALSKAEHIPLSYP